MIISVVKVKFLEDFKIHILFDNGESGIVDLESSILNDSRKVFEPLKNKDYFKKFSLDNWTIVWPNEFGFAPEFLYELAVKQNKGLEKQKV